INYVEFSRDGRILSSSDDKTARLWDGVHGTEIAVMRHKSSVSRAQFSPDGARILTQAYDGWGLWNAGGNTEIPISEPAKACKGAWFNRGGTRILLRDCPDKTVRLWDAVKNSEIAIVRDITLADPAQANFSGDGKLAVSSNDKSAHRFVVRVFDSVSGAE